MCALLLVAGLIPTTSIHSADSARATHYGESFNGGSMSCGGRYSSHDETILAVGYDRHEIYPCGTSLMITGPAGSILVRRSDTCGGCHTFNMVDLSEAGHEKVCGIGTCTVTISRE